MKYMEDKHEHTHTQNKTANFQTENSGAEKINNKRSESNKWKILCPPLFAAQPRTIESIRNGTCVEKYTSN